MPKVQSFDHEKGGHSRAARRTTTSLAEINVVPLVDVMLVLLIIFMVTAPMMQRGVEINLPVARRGAPISAEPIYVTLPLSYRKDRRVLIGPLGKEESVSTRRAGRARAPVARVASDETGVPENGCRRQRAGDSGGHGQPERWWRRGRRRRRAGCAESDEVDGSGCQRHSPEAKTGAWRPRADRSALSRRARRGAIAVSLLLPIVMPPPQRQPPRCDEHQPRRIAGPALAVRR